MPYTMEDFKREYWEARLKEATVEDRLKGLTLEERLRGSTPEEIESYLQRLKHDVPSKKRKKKK